MEVAGSILGLGVECVYVRLSVVSLPFEGSCSASTVTPDINIRHGGSEFDGDRQC